MPQHSSRFIAVFCAAAIASVALAIPALAGPGSGAASLLGANPATAGSRGMWNLSYNAQENFAESSGGMIDVVIPSGWTPPQGTSPISPGYVAWTDVAKVDSVLILGQTVRVYLGGGPHVDNSTKFLNGDWVSILYGVGGGNAEAQVQTTAPATAVFLVSSDPQLVLSPAPIQDSPTVMVVPDTVVTATVVDQSLAPVDTLSRTTDQDTTQLFLLGRDTYGNPARQILADWTLTGGIGAPVPLSGTSTTLRLDLPGTGVAHADSAGVWADSTGAIQVTHGAYAGLTMTAPGSATAGSAFSVTARAHDQDGNTITAGPGSSAAVKFVAYTDSTGSTVADPSLVSAEAVLSGGLYSGSLTARRAGTFWFAVQDSTVGFASERHQVVVAPGVADRIALDPDTLVLTAGVADTVTVLVTDAFGNRAGVPVSETLTLWTDRPAGTFRSVSGAMPIFEVTLPLGADSARFTFTDTQSTISEGRVRAIDANGVGPFLGTAGAPVFTGPALPALVTLVLTPDTLVANGVDSVLVQGTVTDSYGNAVAAGERFTLTGTLVTAVTDQDPGAPGAQLLADSTGTVAGHVQVGITAGAGSATVTAERGGASGNASIRLLAGPPSGAIALLAPADSLAADSVATLAVSATGLHDGNGNQVQDGERYTVATSLGAIVTPDADASEPGIQVAASLGAISFTLFGGDALGTAGVTARAVRDTTSSGALNVRLVPGDVSASQSTVTADSPVPVGATGSVIQVTLRDGQDHPLPGVPEASILVQVAGASATVNALGSATDANGRIDFRATATAVDTGTVQATARGVPLLAQPTISFQPGPLDHYTVSGPPGPLTAGTGITLSVLAFDSFGNPNPASTGVLRPTVTSGAATVPDSVMLAGGAASIPVTPTVASPLTVLVSDDSARSVTYGPVSVNPSGASTLTLLPDSLSLTPTSAGSVTATVRDPQGNPIQGYAITFYLGGPGTSGSLESLGSTSGGPGSQSGVTNSSGQLDVRYRAPAAAPSADSIFVSGGSLGPVGIRAATTPGLTAALQVTASLAWTAGVPESVLVRAVDAFGNFVTTDAATVTMRPSGSVVWNPVSGPLTAAGFTTVGRDTVAETVAIGADRAGGGSGDLGNAVVSPAAPAGVLAIAATRDSLTADGRSAATVTLGPVRDAFSNVVATGTLLGVVAQTGTLVASDASALFPGLDLATGADGRSSVVLIAASAPGQDTLSAVSRAGTATGTHAFTYVPPPTLDYVAGSLAPVSVVPGSAATFSLQARNTGAGTISLGTGSTFSFASGATTFTATLASPASIGAGMAASLTFSSATVPAALTPGAYAPSFRAVGTDATGDAFDFYLSLGGAQVSVAGITAASVSASPDPVPLGHPSLSLVFDVSNLSGTPGDLTGASVTYSTGTFITGAPTPPFGTTIAPGTTTRFTFPVQVPAGGIPPGTLVNATLQATVSFAGSPVQASTPSPVSFRVISAAQVTAVPGTGAPPRFLRGRTWAPSVRVANSGAAAVTLNRGSTVLSIDLGGSTLVVALSANTAVAASDQATLAFDSLAVPAGAPKGLHPATLFLDGVESGQAFRDTISFAPDSVLILDPALLLVDVGSLDPDTVSVGQSRPLSITLRNLGDVPFALDPSTTLRLGAPVTVARALGSGPSLGAGQSLPLTFDGGPLGSPGSPGVASATLEVFGLEDGVPRAVSLGADPLHAFPPAALQYVSRSTSPGQTRPGQTIDVTLDVRNGGGSPFMVDPASTRITVTDGTDVMTGLATGAPFLLDASATATLSFPGLAVPSAMASQPYRVDLSVQGSEWGLAGTVSFSSPDSEIVVLEPLTAIQVRGIDTTPPVQVAPGGAPVRVWGIELTPLLVMGSSTVDSLRSVAITVVSDGSASTAPAASITSIALRDRSGTLLAQSAPAPGAPNPVALILPAPLLMGNTAESLLVDVAFRAGTATQRVAFQLTQGSDVVAVDVVTGSSVPIVGGGGLPFTPLRSRDITFFDRPHGYPNPFHAGSEAILLSYVLGQDAPVTVSIYTLLGDLVREFTLGAGSRGGSGGLNEVPWDGRNGKGELVRPGVYVAKIDGPGVKEQIKVGVLR